MIDFGRAIFKFQDKLFCSDSFAEGGDAHTQYNFPPYWNPAKPIIHPNPSFDLCRLGCSMFDFVFEEDESGQWSQTHTIQNDPSLDGNLFGTALETRAKRSGSRQR